MTFEIALTGINAANTQLEAISNNIANNATYGFKRSRTEFANVYALSSFGASNPSVGQGVRVSNIRQEFEQGDMQFTERNLDLAVEGLGMFKLDSDGTEIYTRSGNFGLDLEGYIVDSSGAKLTGYGVDNNSEIQPITENLQVDFTDLKPNATTLIELAMNLDIKSVVPDPFNVSDGSSFNFSTSSTVYDTLGSPQVASVYFRKSAPNTWSVYTFVDDQEVSQPGGDELIFASDGSLTSVNGGASGRYVTNSFTPASQAEDMQITFDVGDISQFDNEFGVNRVFQDGFAAGQLEGFDIDPTGIIFGRFTNGQAKTMGQITLSSFPNQQGLRQIGTNNWIETYSSGEPATGGPGTASLGKLQAGALEGSNVDITSELVAMIGAQRSFQANAQVISTGDTLTQTVINIRR